MSESGVGIEAMPSCVLDGIVFECSTETLERAVPLDRPSEPRSEFVVLDRRDEAFQVSVRVAWPFTLEEQPPGLVFEVGVEVVIDAEVGHRLEPHGAGLQIDMVLAAGLLTERVTYVVQFNRQRPQRRCTMSDDTGKRIGELVVAIPTPLV